MVPKLEHASESPERLVKPKIEGDLNPEFLIRWSGVGPEFVFLIKFPVLAAAPGSRF